MMAMVFVLLSKLEHVQQESTYTSQRAFVPPIDSTRSDKVRYRRRR